MLQHSKVLSCSEDAVDTCKGLGLTAAQWRGAASLMVCWTGRLDIYRQRSLGPLLSGQVPFEVSGQRRV